MKNKYKSILIFGPPGSGKSTQAKLLRQHKFFYISSGDLLRTLENEPDFLKTKWGRQAVLSMEGGELINDGVMIDLLFNAIEKYRSEGVFNPKVQKLILDGVPRDVSQVSLINAKILVEKIISLTFTDDLILVKRILKRAEVDEREDDVDMDVIKKRITIYNNKTKKVLACYPKDIIFEIDGTGSIDKLHNRIKTFLIN